MVRNRDAGFMTEIRVRQRRNSRGRQSEAAGRNVRLVRQGRGGLPRIPHEQAPLDLGSAARCAGRRGLLSHDCQLRGNKEQRYEARQTGMNPGAANRTGFQMQKKPPQSITITVVFGGALVT